MNTNKSGGVGKLVAFFVIAVTMLLAFGLVADGWQLFDENEPDSGKDADKGGETDENTDGNQENEGEDEPDVYIPQYTDILTGYETTEDASRERPIAYVMNPSAPLYGISGADITVEIPVEMGDTRFLAISSGIRELGKIGSLTATRNYISNIAKYFGAIIVANGSDDSVEYSGCDLSSSSFDLTENIGYSYTEYTHFVYTNHDLIRAGIKNAGISSAQTSQVSIPYRFGVSSPGTSTARTVSIAFSDGKTTELYYSDSDKAYTLSKGGVIIKDTLYDKVCKYENVFVLFADTVTYESADGCAMVMNTTDSGIGFYISGGTAKSISWQGSVAGNMVFYDESGEILTVNCGKSYIAFAKSSMISSVTIS